MLKKIKFCIATLFAICLLSAGTTALASPICPVPTEVTQPDGTVITVTAYGDEFFSWREDENGNVIAYDEATDSYKYAEIEDGKLVPTSEMVGKPSLSRRASKRLQREDIMPLWENAERVDYTQPSDSDITLMSAEEEPEQEKPLTHQKLLVLLVEFNDVPIKFDCDFWNRQMFSTDPNDISVANYWKENANGLDIFEPADTSGIQIGREGLASTEGYDENYTDVKYRIDGFSDGVVKVTLDMPHPTKTWTDKQVLDSDKAAVLAFHAIENDFDFIEEKPHIVAILAGYDVRYIHGTGQGQIHAHTSLYGISTQDGINLGRITVQGERHNEQEAIGIGDICHELGHSVFYLPDLYFNNAIGATPECGISSYSLMSSGASGHRCNSSMPDGTILKLGELPSHLDAWSKIQCGFVTPTMVNDWDGNINCISENGINSKYNVLEIRSKSDPNQYFLVENRQLIGYDRGLEEANNYYAGDTDIGGGIIIWHIDTRAPTGNNSSRLYHPFMWAERSTNEWSPATWAYTGAEGRNTFNGETTPSSNLHQIQTLDNWSCSNWENCHPQTLKSGISIEVLSDNGPSMRVKANVDEEYRVTMVEGAKFTDLFPDANFCRAVIDVMKEKDGIARNPENVLTIRDWATLASIDDLQIEGYGIKDLTGIEHFPILDWLNCSHNEITELTPEQVPNLIFLDCKNNKLTELDLTQWGNLMYLWCENNQLTELDTSQNGVLWDFNCSNNQITALDLSGNVELGYLECQNNKLTSLDFTNNPHLEYLRCFENYMDPETPENSIKGLEPILPEIGLPSSKDDPDTWFAYYPQNISDAEHNWENAWQKDDAHHWHNCADADCPIANNANKDGYGEHIPGEWETVTPATTEREGLRVKKCTVCSAELERETLPKLTPDPPSPPAPGPVEPDPVPPAPGPAEPDPIPAAPGFIDVPKKAFYAEAVEWAVENGITSGTDKTHFSPNLPCTRAQAVTFLWRAAGEPEPRSPAARFDDVKAGSYYEKAVQWAVENGITSGTSKTKFSPSAACTRAQMVAFLYRAEGSPEIAGSNSFRDVSAGAYYESAVNWAVENRVTSGTGGNRFSPDGTCLRGQIVMFLFRCRK